MNEMSESISNLCAALALAQSEIVNPAKDTLNPFFRSRYSSLAACWDACRGPLSKNGLSVAQFPLADVNKITVITMLMHKTGEWMRSALTMTVPDATPQSIGSAITYAKRYAICSIVGLAPEDSDDDGAAASGTVAPKEKSKAQERPGFSTGIPVAQHEAEQAAKAKQAIPQVDHGDFEDLVTSAVIVKEGKDQKGDPWVLYHVSTKSHGRFSTFDSTVFEEARLAATMGVAVMIRTEVTTKGPKVLGFSPIKPSLNNSEST